MSEERGGRADINRVKKTNISLTSRFAVSQRNVNFALLRRNQLEIPVGGEQGLAEEKGSFSASPVLRPLGARLFPREGRAFLFSGYLIRIMRMESNPTFGIIR